MFRRRKKEPPNPSGALANENPAILPTEFSIIFTMKTGKTLTLHGCKRDGDDVTVSQFIDYLMARPRTIITAGTPDPCTARSSFVVIRENIDLIEISPAPGSKEGPEGPQDEPAE